MIKRYVALGDSLSAGVSDWGRGEPNIGFADVLASWFRANEPDLIFINLGVGGARVADVLRAQLLEMVGVQPDLITLAVGANDVPGTPIESFAQDYQALLAELRAAGSGTIAVASIPDFAHLLPPQYVPYRVAIGERVRAFNRIVADAAAAQGALVVDFQDRPEVQDPQNISSDGVHPNARGYRVMARAFAETLSAAGIAVPLPAE